MFFSKILPLHGFSWPLGSLDTEVEVGHRGRGGTQADMSLGCFIFSAGLNVFRTLELNAAPQDQKTLSESTIPGRAPACPLVVRMKGH
jgi:hypothetical protein